MGGRNNPLAFENFVFFAQKNEKNCAFESILVTNPYERTCYAPLLPDLEILAVDAPPVLKIDLRPCKYYKFQFNPTNISIFIHKRHIIQFLSSKIIRQATSEDRVLAKDFCITS